MTRKRIEDLPDALPVMVLPGVTLFPNALLPLYIFEKRYRVMLEEALGSGRMLVMAMPRDKEEVEVEEIAGAGLVRACIRNEDGTSNLILQGVARVRITSWERSDPFRVAKISVLESDPCDEETLAPLVTQLHALCGRFKEQGIELPSQFEAYLNQIDNIGVITDLVASTLVADPSVRQQLLAETDIRSRLSRLLAGLRSQLS
jgi:Lon protease-like protein